MTDSAGRISAPSISLAVGVTLAAFACSRSDEKKSKTVDVWCRGETAIVEPTAADFFESRVVEVSAGHLKVQKLRGGETLQIGVGDAYRVPTTRIYPATNAWMICQMEPHVWSACRVIRGGASDQDDAGSGAGELEMSVVDPVGNVRFSQGVGSLIEPTGLTAMNIQRRFEQSSRRVNFERSFRDAGGPRRPATWQPAPHRLVLAKREGQWFGAQAVDVDEKRVVVRWDGQNGTTDVPWEEVAPQPPTCGASIRGDRALRRPAGHGAAWTPIAVVAVDGADVIVEDVERNRTTIQMRDICPLGAPAQPNPN
jgi:hypothetical protein